MPPQPESSKPSRLITFFRRAGSTAGLWLLVGAALVFGPAMPIVFFALVLVIVVLGLLEYFQLLGLRESKSEATATIVIAACYASVCFWEGHVHGNATPFGFYDSIAIVSVIFAAFVIHLRLPIKEGQTQAAIMACLFGFVYVAFLFGFCTRIVFLDDGQHEIGASTPGRGYILFLIAVTKFSDMGAYVVGSLIGKHKMIPHISPGKTWEGIAGAFLFALIAAFGVTWLFGWDTPLLTPLHTAILAVLICAAAVVGDLAESILKRSLARKDSGHVMPGIGGVLDLVDSILFTAPILYFYLIWLNR